MDSNSTTPRICARAKRRSRGVKGEQLEIPGARVSVPERAGQLLREARDAMRWGDYKRADHFITQAMAVLDGEVAP